MSSNLNFLNPNYQPQEGLTLGFLLSCLFCANFKEDKFDRQFAYILHVSRIKNFRDLRSKYIELNDDHLLQEIFFLSRNDKYFKLKLIREITGIKSPDTFRDRFENYFKEIGLSSRRAFTLEEIYKILDYWNPDFKGDSMRILLKSELAEQYTDGNLDELAELLIDNNIVTEEDYKVDKVSPKVYNALDKFLSKEDQGADSNVHFCLYWLFLLSRIKSFKDY